MASSKNEQRRELRAARMRISERNRAFHALEMGRNVAAFLDANSYPTNIAIAVYSAIGSELDLAPAIALLYSSGAHVLFPCVHEGNDMDFYHLTAAQLDNGARPAFLDEPAKAYPRSACENLELIDPADIDVMLVPGIGFDRDGARLGQGGGCYDRYLARVPARCTLVGVAFDEQIVDHVISEPHDRMMDYVMTPNALYEM